MQRGDTSHGTVGAVAALAAHVPWEARAGPGPLAVPIRPSSQVTGLDPKQEFPNSKHRFPLNQIHEGNVFLAFLFLLLQTQLLKIQR